MFGKRMKDNERITNKSSKSKRKNNTRKKKKGLKIFLTILLILIIIVAGIVTGGYKFIKDKLAKLVRVDINIEELEANEGLDEYRNIAIFALDTRPGETLSRSDGIIILSIDKKTNDVRLISVYRDTYLQIESKKGEFTGINNQTFNGLDKINHAYFYGDAPLAIKTLNKNMDLNIKEFVTVNFDIVAEIINEIGGIEIDVDKSELRYINEYITATSQITGIKSSRVTETGMQKLDGIQAVAYSRIRYTEGGDYKRSERMREVLEAAFKKIKTKSLGEINTILDNLLDKKMIHTNITDNEIMKMLPSIFSYKITESIGWPYDTKGATINGTWYGPPVTLESNVKRLHEELFSNEEDYEVSDYVKEISRKIINRTGYSSM